MGLFKALVQTAVNVATLPLDIVADVMTLRGIATDEKKSYTAQKLEQIKEEADEST
jgi:hypothetical protein